jgi:MOSC domain-containing protein YiiM
MDRPQFPREFLRSGRVGFYLRVVEEGLVRAGDSIELMDRAPEVLTVREASRLRYLTPEDLEGTRRALRVAALPPQWRREFEERLAQAGESAAG